MNRDDKRTAVLHAGCLTRTSDACYTSQESVLQLYNALARAWGGLDVIAPVANQDIPGPFALDPQAVRVIPLPGFTSGWQFHCWKIVPIACKLDALIRQQSAGWKRLWLVDLVPLSLVGRISAERVGLPTVGYLRGDDTFEVVARRTPLLRPAARIFALALARAGVWLVRRTPTFVAGDDLYRKYRDIQPRLYHFVPTVLREAELVQSPRVGPGSPFRALFVGRLIGLKGLEVLLTALAAERRAGFDVELTLVGDGPLRPSLERQAMALGLDGVVRFEGFVSPGPMLDRIYFDHDIFILPSFSEGFPKVLVEALAHGLPVLGTTVGSVPRVIQDGSNGLLVRPGDVEGLRFALRRLANDPASWRRMSDSARASARLYTLERQLAQVEALVAEGES
jgi:glycosyltransferase involved in cell wall biosynthesis